MPYNIFEGNTYKYILTGVDIESRYKVTRALKTKKNKWGFICGKAIQGLHKFTSIPK